MEKHPTKIRLKKKKSSAGVQTFVGQEHSAACYNAKSGGHKQRLRGAALQPRKDDETLSGAKYKYTPKSVHFI